MSVRDVSTQSQQGYFPAPSVQKSNLVLDALAHSLDGGVTLDLAKQSLTSISEALLDELASIGVETANDRCILCRLTLGKNRLTTLPLGFMSLSRLRYLNLRNNHFVVFPDVLTLMPSLDVLDISHNKIKRFPSDPGTLVNLQVLSFSSNKIARLPKYLAKFHRLRILKADRNPVEWPPKYIMDLSNSNQEEFTRSVIKFMEDQDPQRAAEITDISDEGSSVEQQLSLESNLQESYDSWTRLPVHDSEFDAGVTPHARSFSIDSNFSISSLGESAAGVDTPSSEFLSPEHPLQLHLGMLKTYDTSSLRSPESYLPSPVGSTSSTEAAEDVSYTLHGRNASYAGGLRNSTANAVETKKSMPDLRTAKLSFQKKSTPPPPASISEHVSPPRRRKDDFGMPSPLSLRQDSGSSASSSSRIFRPLNRDTHPPPPPPPPSVPPLSSSTNPSSSQHVPSMDFERNSYFRRLSTLPTTAIMDTLPEPLVCFIDSARTILFAVSQVYQAFEHYLVYSIDDRLSSVLRKVLDPASVDMMHLIDSLDRFDALSRKKLPPPAACRSVVESCRDTVTVFGKALGVLALQLKVLANGKDVRYLRHMLLVLYGATAEIAYAWQAVTPHMEALKPLIQANVYPPNRGHVASGSEHSTSSSPPKLQHSRSELHLPYHPPSLSSLRSQSSSLTGDGVPIGRVRTARRHAGSFSSKDVELGRSLPSYDIVPDLPTTGRITRATPRAGRRLVAASSTSSSLNSITPQPRMPFGSLSSTSTLGSSAFGDDVRSPQAFWDAAHSRQSSQASLQTSSVASSPSISTKTTGFLDLPNNSKAQVDKEALWAVKEAVDVAPIVWDTLDKLLAELLDQNANAQESLLRAKSVTKRLAETIRGLQEGDLTTDTKVLRDDAHVFMKAVVQLSNIIKQNNVTLPSSLRSHMVKLTNATEEFAILLHVSSFSPSSIRSHSPFPSSSITSDTQSYGQSVPIAPSLSRSRSAQASPSLKLMAASPHEGPRSAQPHQGFRVPAMRRQRTELVDSVR